MGSSESAWTRTGRSFPAWKIVLKGYGQQVAQQLERAGAQVVNLGLIDTPEKALAAGHEFRRADVDLIFLHVTTYALSSTVLPVVRRAKVPVIILNLSPSAAIDYDWFNGLGDRTKMTGEWLAYCQACPVPEIANVFNRCRIPFFQVTGMLENDPVAWNEIAEWVEAARVAHTMEHNRLGVMGHYYGGMLDIYSDLTQQCAYFGGHIEIVEVDELAALRRQVSDAEIKSGSRTSARASMSSPIARRKNWSARRAPRSHWIGWLRSTSWALWPTTTRAPAIAENEDAISSIILGTSLLTARGIPVAGEYEIKNAQAMKIMDSFGAGGSFTEYYAADFNDDVAADGTRWPGPHRHR